MLSGLLGITDRETKGLVTVGRKVISEHGTFSGWVTRTVVFSVWEPRKNRVEKEAQDGAGRQTAASKLC